MIELNEVFAVFVGEALIALLLIFITMLLISMKRKNRDRTAATGLIEKVSKQSELREKEMIDLLGEDSGVDEESLKEIMNEMRVQERGLYQHVIQLYLKRDAKMLSKIDSRVQALVEPYKRLLSEKSGGAEVDPTLLEEIEKIKLEQERLRNDNERLATQLGVAMETMDEVSTEYSMMFSGSKAADELSASKERMFKIFQKGGEKFEETVSESPEAEGVQL
jgi:hypothetical protein